MPMRCLRSFPEPLTPEPVHLSVFPRVKGSFIRNATPGLDRIVDLVTGTSSIKVDKMGSVGIYIRIHQGDHHD